MADMITILSSLFRMALKGEGEVHYLKDEIAYMENYIKLCNFRFGNMVSCRVDVPEYLKKVPVISMLLQPLVENCVEHGMKSKKTPLNISLKADGEERGVIYIRITDDGQGMEPKRREEIEKRLENPLNQKAADSEEDNSHTGIGLLNIAERIKLHYGEKSYLRIVRSDQDGTEIELCIFRVPERDAAAGDTAEKNMEKKCAAGRDMVEKGTEKKGTAGRNTAEKGSEEIGEGSNGETV